MLEIVPNVSLAAYNSWQVGGHAEYFCLPANIEELSFAQSWAIQNKLKLTVLGDGTNILVSDKGVPGLVICLRKLTGLTVSESKSRLEIIAMAGVSKSELLKIFLRYKLAPAVFLAGVPGGVGGGIVMNAGVGENLCPREFCEIVDWIEVLRPNGQVERLQASNLGWSYRHCKGYLPGIIVRAQISWELAPDDKILQEVKSANMIRLTRQPLDMPNCGSVFRNLPGLKAAQLIDSCGLKGYTVGEAQVSLKHANFIVNLGAAKASDIDQLIAHVQSEVRKRYQVDLITEVVRVGT